MAQVNSIREMFFEKGLNYSEIARATGRDVKTIKQYIHRNNFNEKASQKKELRPSKLDIYKKDIDEWLENDKNERTKQRHTARRVFDRLKKLYKPDFDCSYRLVADYVSDKKKQIYKTAPSFFLPLRHIPGEAQADFGEADFYERNVRHHGHYLNVSFPHSNAGYLQMFKGENQQCLFEGLKNVFAHIGGVPSRIWFDNMAAIVTKILKEGQRDFTEDFLRFKNHHGFTPAMCNPNSGHEKGNVENKVGYHRRNLLVPVPCFDDLEAFNRELLEQCDQGMNSPHYKKETLVQELFEEDKKRLLTLPKAEFDESKLLQVRTDSHGKFKLNKGRHSYSTAPRYASSEVSIRLNAHEVIVLDDDHRQITRHHRLYGKKLQESFDWLPYLTQLSRRPAALKYVEIYDLFSEPLKGFLDQCETEVKKGTIKLLADLSQQSDFSKAMQAIEAAILHGAEDTDSMLAVFRRQNSETVDLSPYMPPVNVPKMPTFTPQVRCYDELFLKGRREH